MLNTDTVKVPSASDSALTVPRMTFMVPSMRLTAISIIPVSSVFRRGKITKLSFISIAMPRCTSVNSLTVFPLKVAFRLGKCRNVRAVTVAVWWCVWGRWLRYRSE